MARALALLLMSTLALLGCESEGATIPAEDTSGPQDAAATDAWWLHLDADGGAADVAPDPGPTPDTGQASVDAGPPPPPNCLERVGCLQAACAHLPGDQLGACYAEHSAACDAAASLEEGEQTLAEAVTTCLADNACGVDGSDIGLECAAAHCVAPWAECWSGKLEGEGNCLDIQGCLAQCPSDPFGAMSPACRRDCAAGGRASSLQLYLKVDWCHARHCGGKEGAELENCESDVNRTAFCHLEWIDCITDRFR